MNSLYLTSPGAETDASHHPFSKNNSIAIIDAGVENWETLAAGVVTGTEIAVLHPQEDGVVQITELLANRHNIQTLHIISHGSPGCLHLGATRLTTDTLDTCSPLIQQWRHALTPNADILIYGCNVAQPVNNPISIIKNSPQLPPTLLHRIHELTGANIAASANCTGSATLGGDWELEVRTGEIAASLAFSTAAMATYGGILAAEPQYAWAKQLGGGSDDYSNSITVDSSGNVYTTGRFEGTVDFDPGAGTFNLTSAGGSDAFISKLDPNGNFLWAQKLGGSGYDQSERISVDSSGNIYTTGHFVGTADFDPGAGTFNLTSAGDAEVFISKLDANGNFLWAKQQGGVGGDYSNSITIDSSGNVYTTGKFDDTVDFDPGAGTFNLTVAGDWDAFISKLDANGNFLWAKQQGGGSYQQGNSITVDSSGNVYTTGTFQDTADFDPSAGTFNLTSAGSSDAFISKLDANGNFLWAKQVGGSSWSDEGKSITLDSSGNVYTTGVFSGTVDFDPGAGTFNLNSAGGSSDAFISKLDPNGNFLWAKQLGGGSNDLGTSITIDSSDNVYTTGDFSGTVDFDPGTGSANLTSAGTFDAFISKLDPNGNFLWAQQLGGGSDDRGTSTSVDSSGNVYTTGHFSGPADFDPGTGTANLTSAGGSDAFISKLSPPPVVSIAPGITPSETGPTTGAFNLTLSQPAATGGVTVNYTVAGTATSGTDYTALSGSVVIPAGSTTATIDLVPVDDTIVDVGETVQVTLSAGTGYVPDSANSTATLAVTDNDWPTVSIAAGSNPSETNATAGNFQITLSNPAPAGGITLNYSVAGTATSDADYTPLSGSLFIAEGATSATIQVVPADDEFADPNETVEVTLDAGTNYNVDAAGATASLTLTDNDTAGVTVSAISGNTSELGGSASFEVVLDTEPTANVTVNLVSSKTSEGTVSVPSLTFTPTNWNVPQTVKVTGADDTVADGNTTYTIKTTVTSTDTAYSSINPSDVSVINIDNDKPNILVTQSGGSTAVTEGGTTDTYQFVLTTAPTANVNITITPDAQTNLGNGAGKVVTRTFTAANWKTPQTVTVTAVNDTAVEYAHTSTLTHSVTSTDAKYNRMTVGDITANVTDNDFLKVNVAAGNNASEANTSSGKFTLTLSEAAPSGGIRVNYAVTGTAASGTDYTTLSGSAFIRAGATTANIDVTPIDDAIDEPDETVKLTVSSGTGYELGTTSSAIISVADNDLDVAQIKEGLASGFDAIENLLDTELSQLKLPIVDKSLQDILTSEFAEKLRTEVLGAINDAFDDGGDDLRGQLKEKLDSVFSEVEIDATITIEEGQFKIVGKNSIDLATIPLDGTLGFPALGITAQGSADSQLEYELSLGFGYHKDYGFYFDTENTELGFDLGIGLSDDFKATGTAGFLQLDLDNNGEDPTKIGAEFKVALEDIDNLPESANDGERLTFSELTGDYNLTDLFATTLDTKANLGLKAVTSIEGNANIPSFNFDLKAEFPVLKYEDGEWSGPQKPTLAFNNMQLDLGTFITDFAKPILTTVNDVVDPARPLIDTLTKDVSPLSQIDGLRKIFDQNNDGKVTLVEAGATIAGKQVDTSFLDALGTIAQVSDLLKEISDQEGTIKIDLGSYELKFDATDPNADLTQAETTTTEEASSPDEQAQSKAGDGKIAKLLEYLNSIEGLSFPIVSKPLTAIDLLLGKDVTLFAYQMPKLDINFGVQQEFPLVSIAGIGINGQLGGNFNAKSNLGFGFDTYGLTQWKNANFALADSYKIFDGFYVSDLQNADGTGPDVNELKLTADISAGANVSALVVKGYLKGGVQGTANLDLIDVGEEEGTTDGKIRGSEIISRISNPLSMFEVNGKVDAFLDAGIDYWTLWDGWETAWSKRLATYNLAEFRLGSGPTRRSRAIDGYISAGTVFFDANFNGVWDAENEPFAITNPDGSFDLMVELEKYDTNQNGAIDVSEGKLVMGDGIDVSTYLPLVTPLASTFDATVVTPLTTLIAQLVEQGMNPAEAQAKVNTALGLPSDIDIQNYEPLEAITQNDARGLAVFASMIQVQNTIVQTAKLIEGVSETPLMQLGYAAIKAIADRVNAGTPMDLAQQSEIEAIINSTIGGVAEAEPTLNASGLATVASAAAEVIGLGNQIVEAIVSNGQSLTDAATDIARLQSVAVGEIATNLPELAAGSITVEQFLAENTQEAIEEKVANAFAKDPTVRPVFEELNIEVGNAADFGDAPLVLPPEVLGGSEPILSEDSSSFLSEDAFDFNLNRFFRFFDSEYYLEQNPDVAEAVENGVFRNAAEHFSLHGFAEGRIPSEVFANEYLTENPDVAEAVNGGIFASGFAHFIQYGFAEGRFPSDVFQDLEIFYLSENPGAAESVANGTYGNGLEHLVRVGFTESPDFLAQFEVLTQTFDAQYYLTENPDVAAAVENGVFRSAMAHFIEFGAVEGRAPSIAFSDSYYLGNYPDVDAGVKNGIFRSGYEHYIMYGMAEGRIGGEMVGSPNADIILGTAGANAIIGNQGDDILFGDAGNDILTGVDVQSTNPGLGEVDRLIGDLGMDTFVLGDANRTYYHSGTNAETGMNDYAIIADFLSSEDIIQLHGAAADYRLAAAPEGMLPGTAIYHKEGDREDLIALVQDVSALNLEERYLSFI